MLTPPVSPTRTLGVKAVAIDNLTEEVCLPHEEVSRSQITTEREEKDRQSTVDVHQLLALHGENCNDCTYKGGHDPTADVSSSVR